MAKSLTPILLVSLSFLTAGCQHWRGMFHKQETPPTGTICQIAATWEGTVRFTHDPANGGATLAGLAGRVYLFGEQAEQALAGEGMFIVDLYDDRPLDFGQIPVRIDQYQIDKETLKKLLRKDTIGWGYTLFLPWPEYRPDFTKVHMFVRYLPERGSPLYATSQSITLSEMNRPNLSVTSRTVIPGSPHQRVTALPNHALFPQPNSPQQQ